MNREEFVEMNWKAYDLVLVDTYRDKSLLVECMVVSISFDTEIIHVRPLDLENFENETMPIHISFIHPKLKVVKDVRDSHKRGNRKAQS